MIGAKVEFDEPSRFYIESLGVKAPKILSRAQRLSVNAAKRALFATIRKHGDAKYNVPKLERRQALTRKLNGGKASDVFGKFSRDSRYMVAYQRGESQVIGWSDRLSEFMSALQDESRRDFTAEEKRALYARLANNGNRGVRLPASYVRPARVVVDRFAVSMLSKFPDWVSANFERLYQKQFPKRF